jgi:hypothetical protein
MDQKIKLPSWYFDDAIIYRRIDIAIDMYIDPNLYMDCWRHHISPDEVAIAGLFVVDFANNSEASLSSPETHHRLYGAITWDTAVRRFT